MTAAVTEAALSVVAGDAARPKLVVEQFVGRSFKSYVPGVEQQNLLTSHDVHVVQAHVWVGADGVSIGRRPVGVTKAVVGGDNVLVTIPMGSARPDRVNGRPLLQSYFWITGPGAGVDVLQTQPYTFGQIVLPANVEVLDPLRQDVGLAVFEVGDEALAPLRDLIARIVLEAAVTPETLSGPRAAALVHENIVLALSELSDHVLKLNVGRLSFPAAYRLVMQIDEYIRAVGAAEVSLQKMARDLDCSLRTIRASLLAVKGMGLGRYLWTIRLWNVRRALETGPPGTLVKTVVLQEGFWHQGRFARRYCELFGETPSQTLQRARGR